MGKWGKERLLGCYRTMVRIREFELTAAALYEAAEIPGFVHLYAGEEAIAAGVCEQLGADDMITSTHRGHGHLIAKGGRVDRMMAELLGKVTGYCNGRGGSMHICDPDLGILGSNGIVGAGFPIATGAALAAKTRGAGAVSICFFGDAASNRGTFHECLNLAAVWELPVVYVCENNLYGISVSARDAMRIDDVADRGVSYGIPSQVVDGNDVMAVADAMEGILTSVRAGGGPFLLECKTWRHRGHFEGDPDFCNDGLYRDRAEHAMWLERDPLPRHRAEILKRRAAKKSELDEIHASAKAEIAEAVRFARESPDPDPYGMMQGLYA
jgi:pyruvate dehydrogenase E1 component alpha subunit